VTKVLSVSFWGRSECGSEPFSLEPPCYREESGGPLWGEEMSEPAQVILVLTGPNTVWAWLVSKPHM
jgi:hypothetical protein